MPKKIMEPKLMRQWWGRAILGAGFFALSYGLISLAIDSGSLLEYALGIIFGVYGIVKIAKSLRFALKH